MRWHSSPVVVATLLVAVLAALAAAALVVFGDSHDLPAVRLSGACCGVALQPLRQPLPAA